MQGRIQDFKLGGALKKIAPSGGRRENCWGNSCEKSRFYAKKIIFSFRPGNMENTIANIRILDVVRLVHGYFIFVFLYINMLS
jgi:hypothetical protein